MHTLIELIKGGIHDQCAKANGQGEEHLRYGRIPDMRIEQLPPLWLYEIGNALPGARQGYRSDQQDQHDGIGKECQEVGCFARAAYTLEQGEGNDDPGDQQADDHLPAGRAEALIQAFWLTQHCAPASGYK